MSKLKTALDLAEKGFHVFPLKPNTKLPAIKDFENQATKDPEQIKSWWYSTAEKREVPYNIGICTSNFNCTQALVVVDVDNKEGKNGSEEVLKLELEGKEFSATFTQKTPTGGEHYVYKSSTPLKQGSNVLGRGLDIRSKGGYIVGPGSVIDGKEYVVSVNTEPNEVPPVDC